jgi:hypothetical protein
MSVPTDPRALLEAAVARSGLSLRAFARERLARDERTARRWRAGETPIPEAVLRWLRRYLAAPAP